MAILFLQTILSLALVYIIIITDFHLFSMLSLSQFYFRFIFYALSLSLSLSFILGLFSMLSLSLSQFYFRFIFRRGCSKVLQECVPADKYIFLFHICIINSCTCSIAILF